MITLTGNYTMIRTIAPVLPDADWVTLQAVPVEPVDASAVASAVLKISARDADMRAVKGTCDVEVVRIGDDGVVISVASQTLGYLAPMTVAAGATIAVRITGATGLPATLNIVAKGIL